MTTDPLTDLADALGLPPDRAEAVAAVIKAAAGLAADRPPLAGREWLTINDVVRLTGLKYDTVQDKARRSLIPMIKVFGAWRMTPAAFDAWEARQQAEGLPVEGRYPRKR